MTTQLPPAYFLRDGADLQPVRLTVDLLRPAG
jgi:hypothetical protein